jgi:hypothetical protein
MPNWCFNTVTFTHDDPVMINRIESGFKRSDDHGLFSEFLPVPEGYSESGAWYGWCNANWGTKWDVSEADCNYIEDRSENSIRLYFETAWSPPIEFYEKLLELGFSISAYYFEPGMGFVGSWKDGHDECYDGFSHDIDGIVPSHLVDMFNIHDWYEVEEDEETSDEQSNNDSVTNKE